MSWWTRWGRLAGLLVLMVALYFVIPLSGRLHLNAVLRGLVTLLVLALVAGGFVVQLRRHVDDLARRVDGLVVAIVLVVLVFALSFYLLERAQPGQLEGVRTRVDALYFTMSTMTTVGYGDVHAVGQAARILVLIQMAFNVVFVAAAASLLSFRVKTVVEVRARQRDGRV